jgi:hypothetical protein
VGIIVEEGRDAKEAKMTEGNLVSKRTTRVYVEDHHIVENCTAGQMTYESQRRQRSLSTEKDVEKEKEGQGRWSSASSVDQRDTPPDIATEFDGIGMVPYGVEDHGKEGIARHIAIPLDFISNILYSFQEAPGIQGGQSQGRRRRQAR